MTDLSQTLLLIPCCASKQGAPDPGLPRLRVADLLGASARQRLDAGREVAFARPKATLEHSTPTRPALAYYTGNPYAVPGFRDQLVAALGSGLHCLIISGGYGLLRPEEPIHRYQAHLSATKTVWRRRLPAILRDYVARNVITTTFGAFSSGYAAVVPDNLTGDDHRYVPTFRRGIDAGSAMRVVPERVGHAVLSLLASGLDPDSAWTTQTAHVPAAHADTPSQTPTTPPPTDKQARPSGSPSLDVVWRRITRAAGERFHLARGKPFTYSVRGNSIDLHTTNRQIPRSDIAKALNHVPLASTTVANRLGVQGPSYVYAILTDSRIRESDW